MDRTFLPSSPSLIQTAGLRSAVCGAPPEEWYGGPEAFTEYVRGPLRRECLGLAATARARSPAAGWTGSEAGSELFRLSTGAFAQRRRNVTGRVYLYIHET